MYHIKLTFKTTGRIRFVRKSPTQHDLVDKEEKASAFSQEEAFRQLTCLTKLLGQVYTIAMIAIDLRNPAKVAYYKTERSV